MKLVVIISTFQLSSSVKHTNTQLESSSIEYAAPMDEDFMMYVSNKRTKTKLNKSKYKVLLRR